MEQKKVITKPKTKALNKALVIKSVCNVGEVFISCCRFDDNSKIGCAYCRHFKQTVL